MSAGLSRLARYVVAGEPGTWRYAGQATYVDEGTGAAVEHDHVRMVQGAREVWVPPGEVRRAARPAARTA